MKHFAFKRGGIHPHDFKISAGKSIVKFNIPRTVRILMSQHLGAPAKALVKEGDTVEEGQLIAETTGFISANIHASVPGKVSAVGKMDTPTARGVEYIEIETGGNVKNWYAEKKDYSKLSNEELITMVKGAGIVGMGGATFPAHVKLSPPKDKKITTFILNGAECEPYLTIDHQMMLEKTDELLEGVNIIMKILGAEKTYIGIEENKPDAIAAFEDKIGENDPIEVDPLRTRYPQGGEKQLIEAITGLQVPSGGLPSDIGVVVFNVSTVYAIYEAIVYGKPLIERGLTYSGDGVENCGNFKVRIGTPIKNILDEYGLPDEYASIILGGPMMGHEISDTLLPVTKGTSGIVVLSKKHSYEVKDMPCIRCSRCYMVCPMGLEPSLLAKLSDNMKWEEAGARGLMDCMECGSCAYVCPSTIPLVGLMRFGKGLWRRKTAKK
jgi:electron transport complex protein RnfC